MCARFTQFGLRQIQENFGLKAPLPDLIPLYNIAPSQVVPVVLLQNGLPTLDILQWGLVPAWADDPSIGQKLINARSETLAEKPSFRAAYKYRRCLIPTDGFYEWDGPKSARQPHFVRTLSQPTAFAGLWEEWERPEGLLRTFTIVTTAANAALRHIHERMPVWIPQSQFARWLDPKCPVAKLEPLFTPWPDNDILIWPVSPEVNRPSAQGPHLIEPYTPPTEPQGSLF